MFPRNPETLLSSSGTFVMNRWIIVDGKKKIPIDTELIKMHELKRLVSKVWYLKVLLSNEALFTSLKVVIIFMFQFVISDEQLKKINPPSQFSLGNYEKNNPILFTINRIRNGNNIYAASSI